MKTTVFSFLLYILLILQVCKGQIEGVKDYRNFPLVLSIQFHSLAMPFKDFKSNFKNVGFGIGTEISLNGSRNWVQQFDLIWVKNKGIGNALLFSSKAAWRPQVAGGLFTEVKAGVGYMLAKNPSKPYKQKNGEWIVSEKKRKGMLTVPVGIGMGYYQYSPNTFVSPFAGYQLLLVSGYNQTLPLVPQTLLQSGLRIHPNYNQTSID